MRILAIDQSTNVCGYACGEPALMDRVRLVSHGRITLPDTSLGFKMLSLRTDLDRLFKAVKPALVVYERYHWRSLKSDHAVKALAGVTALIDMVADDHSVEIADMMPQEVKGACGVRDKDEMIHRMQGLYGLTPREIRDHNHADALGLLAAYTLRWRQKQEAL